MIGLFRSALFGRDGEFVRTAAAAPPIIIQARATPITRAFRFTFLLPLLVLRPPFISYGLIIRFKPLKSHDEMSYN
jgi:hypothetical protein